MTPPSNPQMSWPDFIKNQSLPAIVMFILLWFGNGVYEDMKSRMEAQDSKLITVQKDYREMQEEYSQTIFPALARLEKAFERNTEVLEKIYADGCGGQSCAPKTKKTAVAVKP